MHACTLSLPFPTSTPSTPSPSAHEIDAELFRLYALTNRQPIDSTFGDSNHDAIRAQIWVLRGRKTIDEVAERYEDGDLYIFSAALDAAGWLSEGGQAMSTEWQAVIETDVALQNEKLSNAGNVSQCW